MDQANPYPAGTVAFLFTDIAGSTKRWQDHADAMAAAYARHDALLRGAIAHHRGVAYKVIGDAIQAAFPIAHDALAAALTAQRGLLAEDWTAVGLPAPLRVRMALHAGPVDRDPDGDYRSPVLNRLGRLLAAGHGGQVLLSAATQELVRDHLPAGASLRDLGEHRLKDLYRPERVYQLQHPALPADFPPLRSLEAHPTNLPLQPTPFLGREREVAQVTELLRRDEVRLLTLTGPGGIGKTRLALQAAADLLDRFPDGAWFVDLAPLSDPALVPAAVAGVLGVREEGGQPLAASLAALLAAKRLLLLLDNCEQVADAAPFAAGLLAAAPGIKVLATSRTRLRLRGEREVAVPPLGLPDPARLPDLARLSQYEAVRLFVARAQDARADFAVTNANAPAVAAICHRLDGLPLAIELAAARVKVFPLEALLKRLENRLKVLTGGARDLPARQRTLRDAIAWSYDLLGGDEPALFRRLAVFAGGATFEAAEAVVSPEGALDVFDGLPSLVDKSLLRREEGPDGEPRFGMLETIREFALGQLVASGEREEVVRRHAAYFLDLAQREDPLWGAIVLEWVARLEADHANVRAALGWLAANDPLGHVRMAGLLGALWYFYGHLVEGRRWLDGALTIADRLGDALAAVDHARVLISAGLIRQMQGDQAQAQASLERALARAVAAGDPRMATVARTFLGGALVSGGRYDEAEPLFEDALAQWQALERLWWVGHALFHLGLISYARRDWDRAVPLLAEAVQLYDAHDAELEGIDPLHYQALIACERGDFTEAAGIIADVLRRLRRRGSEPALADGLADVATLAAFRGDHAAAARLFGAAARLLEAGGGAYSLPARDTYERAQARARQELPEEAWRTAFAAGRAMPSDRALAEAEALLTAAAAGDGASSAVRDRLV